MEVGYGWARPIWVWLKINRRGKPQVLVHVSTYQGKPFGNSGLLVATAILESVDVMGVRNALQRSQAPNGTSCKEEAGVEESGSVD